MLDSERVVWEPTAEYFEGSHLQGAMARLQVPDYDDLYRLSIDHPDRFWKATLDDIGIEWMEPYQQFVDLTAGPEWARWFVGGKMNIAQSAVTRWAGSAPGRLALSAASHRNPETMTIVMPNRTAVRQSGITGKR